MICFFDTETNGLPGDMKRSILDLDNWPRVIQLAWMITDVKGNELNKVQTLIKPDGWVVPFQKFWIDHGFSTEQNEEHGVPMRAVMAAFIADLAQCDFLVSHNMEFDHKVLGSEMIRYGVKGKQTLKICTKEASTQLCKIPFAGGSRYSRRWKWPKLSELHKFLFGRDFDDAHSAGGDVAALKTCFFELVNRGVIVLPEPARL